MGIGTSHAALLAQSLSILTTTQTLIKAGEVFTPSKPPELPPVYENQGEVYAEIHQYKMYLAGSFKSAKCRIVADFTEAYYSRLTQITNGDLTEAAQLAGLHRSNYLRTLKRAQESRQEFDHIDQADL